MLASEKGVKLEREELVGQIREFLVQCFQAMRLQLEVTIETSETEIRADLSGDDSGALLGDNARLLYALNHLVNQIFYRRAQSPCSFTLDSNQYRAGRDSELKLLAEKAAEQVSLTGTRVSLQPMPSSERRTIHLALADNLRVRTVSEGTGRNRRVLILPA